MTEVPPASYLRAIHSGGWPTPSVSWRRANVGGHARQLDPTSSLEIRSSTVPVYSPADGPGAVDAPQERGVRPRALELSGLTRVRSATLLAQRKWDVAFWSVGDERNIDNAIVLIGRRADAKPDADWELEQFEYGRWQFTGPEASDSEAVAYHDGFVYVIGSHYGHPDHGLQPKRAFVARFREEDVPPPEQRGGTLQIAPSGLRLHRAINDALRGTPEMPSGLALFEPGSKARQNLIGRALEAPWNPVAARDLGLDDLPVNIEGLTFRSDGSALIGLRFPVDSRGHPLVVEIPGFASAIFEEAPLMVGPVWILEEIGTPEFPLGIRDLESSGVSGDDSVSAIVGGIGDEVMPSGRQKTRSFAHWTMTLPRGRGGAATNTICVRPMGDRGHVEGVAGWPGDAGFAYVADGRSLRIQFTNVGRAATPAAGQPSAHLRAPRAHTS